MVNEVERSFTDYNIFANNFLGKVATAFEDDEFLASPIGLFLLLTTLIGSGGVRGNSSDQIYKTILPTKSHIQDGMNDIQNEAKAVFVNLKTSLETVNSSLYDDEFRDNSQINIRHRLKQWDSNNLVLVTGLFIQSDIPILANFEHTIQKEFKCSIERVDFENWTASVTQINTWINNQTHGLITEVFKTSNDITLDTRLIFVNAIYLTDEWETPFPLDRTTLCDFEVSPTQSLQIQMMQLDEEMSYGEFKSDGFRMISKSLKNGRLTFIVILPIKKFDKNYMADILSGKKHLSYFVNQLNVTPVSLILPKFRIDISLNLVDILQSMGVTNIFNQHLANLSGISNSDGLYINALRQNTVLNVYEDGIEASSITDAVITPIASFRTVINFHVAFPFICSIYDTQSQSTIMVANVMEPKFTSCQGSTA